MMRRRYLLSMVSLLPLMVTYDLVYFTLHRSTDILLLMGGMHAVLYGPVLLAGSWWLYRPIDRSLRDGGDAQAAGERIGRLTWRSACLAGGLGFVTLALSLLSIVAPQLLGDAGAFEVERVPAWFVVAGVPDTFYIYCIFPAFVIYFLINDFVLDLRSRLFVEFGLPHPPGRRRIGRTLVAVMAVLGVIPILLIVFELAVAANTDYSQFTELSPLHTVMINRFVTLIGIVFAVVLVTRAFTKPIDSLLAEIEKVKAGDFSARSSVITEDEFGVLALQFNEMVKGLREREFIRDTFGKYVTPDVAGAILERRIDTKGEIRVCTVLVMDVAGYTTLSEGAEPREVVEMLNEYFSTVVGIIQEHHGVVNKFIGDAVFAIFNVPLDDPNHAANAIRAALEIERVTAARTFRGQRLETRIGINTGEVLAGNFGSAERFEYTVIGDAVNVAARLEQLNKQHGTTVLIGERTARAAGAAFPLVCLGEVQLKGKAAPSEIYGLERARAAG